jgi:hypothetical protein
MWQLRRNYKMNNVQFLEDAYGNKIVLIDRGNEEYTSMLKSTYDEMIAAQSTPSIPEGGN